MKIVIVVFFIAFPLLAQDSPYVIAAKRANRVGRKSKTPVITNATLSRYGSSAHVTTTETQTRIPVVSGPLRPTPEMIHAENRAKAEQARLAAEREAARLRAEEEQKLARRAAMMEEGYDSGQGDDAEEIVPPPD